MTDISLKYNQGITFDLTFAEGALSLYTNFAPYWFIIAGVVLLILLFAVKFLAFNKNGIVPVVNFEAPEKMNPLMMGKLIDYTVNPEDITSMIFYWADKGYLKIDLTNQKDPALIRIVQSLPQGTPAYEVTLFNEMFRGKDVVQPSSLKYRFYKTIDKVSVILFSISGSKSGTIRISSPQISQIRCPSTISLPQCGHFINSSFLSSIRQYLLPHNYTSAWRSSSAPLRPVQA